MNEKLIDNVIQDYSLRELQMHSSRILSNYNATNMFIKQFKADYDSQQFYKNVIKWYVQKEKKFPEEHVLISHEERYWEKGYFKKNNLRFVFPVNQPGLGDRFVMTSNILSTIKHYRDKHCVVDIFLKTHPSTLQEQYLNFIDFYDVIDFFHFERPQEKITTNVIDEEPPPYKEIKARKRKNITGTVIAVYGPNIVCHNYNMRLDEYKRSNYSLYNRGKYWPITYDKTVKKKLITFMFYVKDNPDRQFEHKFITTEEERVFTKIINDYHYWIGCTIQFVRLEDLNFAKNVELLSQSHLFIASEGMWTHLSRAMDIDTIAYTKDDVFIYEFNSQGHFASGNFEECLIKLNEKCTTLPLSFH